MGLNVQLEIKARCMKHRLYDPLRDGEAGIKGGCTGCLELLKLRTAVGMVYTAAEKLSKMREDTGMHVQLLRWKRPKGAAGK
jgi:hypothetical protein